MKFEKSLRLITALSMALVAVVVTPGSARAAEMADGTWSRSGQVDTITITTSTGLSSGDIIVLTFDDTYDTVATDTNTQVTVNAVNETAVMNTTDNTATITLANAVTAGSRAIVGDFLNTTDSGVFDAALLGQHSVAVNTTTSAGAALDFGVAVTVTNLNDNTVAVTATVPQFINMTLSKVAVNLGVLSAGSVKTDSHTIVVNSNDDAGYLIQVASNGDLTDGTNTINAVSENTTVVAGTEAYGIAVTAGTASEVGDFADDDTPLPTSATDFIGNTATASAHSHTVEYRASIDGNTVSGTYTQVVTYTIASKT